MKPVNMMPRDPKLLSDDDRAILGARTFLDRLPRSPPKKDEVELIRRRHQIYCGLAGKDLELLTSDPPGRTDCETFVSIPIEDPDAPLIHQHEWQHVLMKTDLPARTLFVEKYIEQLRQRLPNTIGDGPVLANTDPHRLSQFIHLFINGLDDLRVCSLWEDPYPQSAEDIANRWKRVIVMTGRAKNDIILYMMALGLNLREAIGTSHWKNYEAILESSAKAVLKQGFVTCLAVAKDALDAIIFDERIEAEAEKAERAAKTLQLFSTISVPNGYNEKLMDTNVVPVGDPNPHRTEQLVSSLIQGVNLDWLQKEAKNEVERIVESLKGPKRKQLTRDETLLKGLDGVKLIDVKPGDVSRLDLEPEDNILVQVLRQKFTHLMNKKSQTRSDSGSELDPSDYVEFLMGSGDVEYFKDEVQSKGFSALILIDMSGSMIPLWIAVSRACKVLAKSMKFPFSKFEVWGFTSSRDEIRIYRFQDTEKGYAGRGIIGAWGLTPLHVATEVSMRHLRSKPEGVQHLFILTDGEPTHYSPTRHMVRREYLIEEMAQSILKGAKVGVSSYGLVLGNRVSNEVSDKMFGASRWRRIDLEHEDLFDSLVDLVDQAFVGYLKGK